MLNMLWPGRSKVLFLAGARDVSLPQMSGQSVGLTEPPVYCVLGVLFLGVEWLGCEFEC